VKNHLYISLVCAAIYLSSCKNENAGGPGSGESGGNLFKAALFSSSSSPESLQSIEYVSWIENPENGLKQEKVIGDLSFTLQYKPLEFIALKALGPSAANAKGVQEARKEYEGMQYYTLTINNKSGINDLLKYEVSDMQEYQQRVSYFSFDMQRDLLLVEGEDSLKCRLFHYERVYGLAPYATFLLGFDLPAKKSGEVCDKVLVYRERVFETGMLKFRIKAENLNNVPELKF
jgi:hypothetical protein